MTRCGNCGKVLAFGGAKVDGVRYCNKICAKRGPIIQVTAEVPDEHAVAVAHAIHNGECPECHAPGGVEAYNSYWAVSVIRRTNFGTSTHVCCRSCAVKKQTRSLLACAGLGWWSLPFGPVITIVQLYRNINAILFVPFHESPSAGLIEVARRAIAERTLEASQGGRAANATVPGRDG